MRTACSLTISHHIPWMPPCNHAHPVPQPHMSPATMHTPNNCTPPPTATHAQSLPLQPHMPPCNHACLPQPHMCPPQPCIPTATMHAPPPHNHAHPLQPHMPPSPSQPCMPPLWTEWQTGVKILPCPKLRLRAVKMTQIWFGTRGSCCIAKYHKHILDVYPKFFFTNLRLFSSKCWINMCPISDPGETIFLPSCVVISQSMISSSLNVQRH